MPGSRFLLFTINLSSFHGGTLAFYSGPRFRPFGLQRPIKRIGLSLGSRVAEQSGVGLPKVSQLRSVRRRPPFLTFEHPLLACVATTLVCSGPNDEVSLG
jgi:hypothetical protein